MPLPKPPVQLGTLLSIQDYAIPQVKKVRKTSLNIKEKIEIKTSREPTPQTPSKSPDLLGQKSIKISRTAKTSTSVRQPKSKPKPNTNDVTHKSDIAKLFVLDANVLMHDPTSLFRFDEHDIYLPMRVLEKLDNYKKGISEVSRNVRQVLRDLDTLIAHIPAHEIDQGIPLSRLGHKRASGRLFFQATLNDIPPLEGLLSKNADTHILSVTQTLSVKMSERPVILVSKDINMRIKARAIGVAAEDYLNDCVLGGTDLLYSGMQKLPDDFWIKHSKGMQSWQDDKLGGIMFYRLTGPLIPSLFVNQFVFIEPVNGQAPFYGQVIEINRKTAVLQTLRDYTDAKNSIFGITARNREQNFALNLLMNPECDFVTLLGQAGTGKTLLALASGLTQVLEKNRYKEIIMTQITMPGREDRGFLPGIEEEKIVPWMEVFDDTLKVLNQSDANAGEWGHLATQDLIRSRIKVKSLNFMRGRTLVNKFLIIDEAQNLSAMQIKTLLTGAGPGTKIVCLGNIVQIDTPYLTERSSGLTYVVNRFKGWSHSGHIMLTGGECSRLAGYATKVLSS